MVLRIYCRGSKTEAERRVRRLLRVDGGLVWGGRDEVVIEVRFWMSCKGKAKRMS